VSSDTPDLFEVSYLDCATENKTQMGRHHEMSNASSLQRGFFFALTSFAHAITWQPSNQSCEQTCLTSGGAYKTGEWAGGGNFDLCRANAGKSPTRGEGFRPGYNLGSPLSHGSYPPNVCVVPYDGKEATYTNFECLCVNP
jgi:hypothetical protein